MKDDRLFNNVICGCSQPAAEQGLEWAVAMMSTTGRVCGELILVWAR